MLVFSRKKDESVIIGSDIEIKIISIGRDTVKVGIEAPRHITIHRKEIFLAIEEENRRAAAQAVLNANQLKMLKGLKGLVKVAKPGAKPAKPEAVVKPKLKKPPLKNVRLRKRKQVAEDNPTTSSDKPGQKD